MVRRFHPPTGTELVPPDHGHGTDEAAHLPDVHRVP